MNEYQEYQNKLLDSMDDIFIEMFGKGGALSIYHRMGKAFEREVAEDPDRYSDKENKRKLIVNLISLEYDLNTVWYE